MQDFVQDYKNNANTREPSFINSPLKWAGGKKRLLNHLIYDYIYPYSQINPNATFYEPFLGSGTVAFNSGFKKMVLGDKNPRLMIFYKEIRDRPEKVLTKILKYQKIYTKTTNKEQYYYQLRNEFNNIHITKNSGVKLSALFWILNKTGFNGMYRETKEGKFNIPFGKRPCPSPKIETFMQISNILKNSEVKRGDFENICQKIKKGDIIYLDPPYIPISKTASFNTYLKNGFNINDQKRLKRFMKKMNENGVKIIMSNSDCKLTRDIYGKMKNFHTNTIKVQRLISGKSKGRTKIQEIIMTNL